MTIPILGTLYLDVTASVVLRKACQSLAHVMIYFPQRLDDSTLLWYIWCFKVYMCIIGYLNSDVALGVFAYWVPWCRDP